MSLRRNLADLSILSAVLTALSPVLLSGSIIVQAHADPGQTCGAHTDALDCRIDTSPPTPAEQNFARISRGEYGNDADIVQVLRGTCVMLTGGDTTGFIVSDLAQHQGISNEAADQLMDGAMETDCPHLTIGSDGAAYPS